MFGKQYLVPRADGRVLIGSTEEPEAGFEKGNTAEGVAELLAFATRLVPGLASAELERCWSGLRPARGMVCRSSVRFLVGTMSSLRPVTFGPEFNSQSAPARL